MTASVFHQVTAWLFHRVPTARATRVERAQVRRQVLDRARRAIRNGRIEAARALVEECSESADRDPSCLNVLGLIAEAQSDWTAARKHWSKALRADPCYTPAYQNLRRYFELFQWGCSPTPIAFGDEPPFAVDLKKDSES